MNNREMAAVIRTRHNGFSEQLMSQAKDSERYGITLTASAVQMIKPLNMTQCEAILWYMDTIGSISPMEAFTSLRITKLATRISELRRGGYEIEGVWEGTGNTKYMRYRRKDN